MSKNFTLGAALAIGDILKNTEKGVTLTPASAVSLLEAYGIESPYDLYENGLRNWYYYQKFASVWTDFDWESFFKEKGI